MVSAQQQCACKTLQRWFRSWGKPKEKQKSQAFRWPTIFELRGLYLDADALAAGAKESEMYSDEALRAREQLRSSPEVRTPALPSRTKRAAHAPPQQECTPCAAP